MVMLPSDTPLPEASTGADGPDKALYDLLNSQATAEELDQADAEGGEFTLQDVLRLLETS